MRVKTDAKRRAILAAAAEVFREHGFAGASVSAVCERVGASKATLYRYFDSKEDLFVTLMLDAALEHFEDIFGALKPSEDLRRALERFGAAFLELGLSEGSLSLRRNAIAEGPRSGLGQELYDRGARVLWSTMADFLGGEMAAGRLRPEDPWTAAMHLRGLLEADLINRALIGARIDDSARSLKAHAVKAVDVFLRAYGQTSNDKSASATPPSTGKVAPTT